MLKILAIAASLVLFFGCASQTERNPQAPGASDRCISACQKAVLENRDLSAGPCLLDPIPDFPDWVCDVAHAPREPVDNDPKNQCASFREGKASRFVEVNAACSFIREA